MLDPFAQLFQHCWGHARSLRMDYNDLWVVSVSTMHCSSQTCWTGRISTLMLGVVATPLPTRMQQLPTLLAQQCWDLLRPFARSLMG